MMNIDSTPCPYTLASSDNVKQSAVRQYQPLIHRLGNSMTYFLKCILFRYDIGPVPIEFGIACLRGRKDAQFLQLPGKVEFQKHSDPVLLDWISDENMPSCRAMHLFSAIGSVIHIFARTFDTIMRDSIAIQHEFDYRQSKDQRC